jgi:hypothetical protein
MGIPYICFFLFLFKGGGRECSARQGDEKKRKAAARYVYVFVYFVAGACACVWCMRLAAALPAVVVRAARSRLSASWSCTLLLPTHPEKAAADPFAHSYPSISPRLHVLKKKTSSHTPGGSKYPKKNSCCTVRGRTPPPRTYITRKFPKPGVGIDVIDRISILHGVWVRLTGWFGGGGLRAAVECGCCVVSSKQSNAAPGWLLECKRPGKPGFG